MVRQIVEYKDASPINKMRVISAYCGIFVWDCLDETDQTKWFTHTFTDEDAIRVLIEWEKGMDEQEGTTWRTFTGANYQEYLNGSVLCDGRDLE